MGCVQRHLASCAYARPPVPCKHLLGSLADTGLEPEDAIAELLECLARKVSVCKAAAAAFTDATTLIEAAAAGSFEMPWFEWGVLRNLCKLWKGAFVLFPRTTRPKAA